jgi:hypothetical protein
MELILLAIFSLVLIGSLDRWLHPQSMRPQPMRTQPRRHATGTRRAAQRHRARGPAARHRHSPAQVRPFMSMGSSVRR